MINRRYTLFFFLAIFLVPLGYAAGHFCWLSAVDPIYHGWVWLHERVAIVLVVLALAVAASALLRFLSLQRKLGTLLAMSQTPPSRVVRAFAELRGSTPRIAYVRASVPFCFTSCAGPTVVMSSAFETLLDDRELRLVALHEQLHICRHDPLRALLWHLFFAALILPGFEGLEDALHVARERAVDRAVDEKLGVASSRNLIARLTEHKSTHNQSLCVGISQGLSSSSMTTSSRCLWLRRIVPAGISLTMLALVFVSHDLFMHDLPYLLTHHC